MNFKISDEAAAHIRSRSESNSVVVLMRKVSGG